VSQCTQKPRQGDKFNGSVRFIARSEFWEVKPKRQDGDMVAIGDDDDCVVAQE